MVGRRLPDETHAGWRPGDYGRIDGVWHVRPPKGDVGVLEAHTVMEHEDGTITVSPSILLEGVWHGFLERGVWREC